VLHAYLTDQKRCYNHPHRAVGTACARCKTPYCDECLTTRSDGVFGQLVARDEKNPAPLFCERCIAEVDVLNVEAAWRHRPLWQRLLPGAAGMRRAATYAAVIAVIMVPIAFAVRNMASTTLSPEELARVKIGLMGTFQTPDGTNFLSNVRGGTFVRAAQPSQPSYDPSRLIDTWATSNVPSWRSQNASVPQEMVFALPQTLRINRIVLLPRAADPEETWVKDFEVLVSTQSADAGFTSILRGTLDLDKARAGVTVDQANLPRFDVPDATARWVMLRVLSNQGSGEYTSLAEFETYWHST
jgi:hypothetical protein